MADEERKRVLIVGGVAGGASCAARLRRLCERREIVMFDRGLYVSFANCGLPYYVGNVIAEEEKLLVATPQLFKNRFNIEVHTETEVTCIDRDRREIEVRQVKTGDTRRERYDALVLATGARAIRPSVPGIDLPGIFVIRTIPDTREIRRAIEGAKRAVVIGAGFIGLEMAENLIRRGLTVTVLELTEQVLPPLDPEMAAFVSTHLEKNGVELRLGEGVAGFRAHPSGGLTVSTTQGKELVADIAVLALGVRPDVSLARAAGLEIGDLGGVRVDDCMRTSDPHIWAVGDMVEVRDVVTGKWQLIPLAGPANRQGRIAAASILGRSGPGMSFRGVQATAVCGVLGLTVAMTGASEKALRRAGNFEFEKVYLHPGNHAGYYPGATPIHMKLLFAKKDGRILGAQAIGQNGVARRIDVIATAIQMRGSVYDLEEAELCYAPQFGAAKDPVNIAGMIAANHLRGDFPLAEWEAVDRSNAYVLDVRSPEEFAGSHLPGAVNIPLDQLRNRLDELPREREIWPVCAVGQRSYYAVRLLLQNGFAVKGLPGGTLMYEAFEAAGLVG